MQKPPSGPLQLPYIAKLAIPWAARRRLAKKRRVNANENAAKRLFTNDAAWGENFIIPAIEAALISSSNPVSHGRSVILRATQENALAAKGRYFAENSERKAKTPRAMKQSI